MARKQRFDSVAGSANVMKAAAAKIDPCMTLTDQERSFFDVAVSSRETASWTPHDNLLACRLAKALRRQDELDERLDAEGLTLVNDRGTTVAHPLLSASMTIANTIQSLTRTLGLSAAQRGMTGSEQTKRNKADADAKKVISRASEETLLA